MISSMAHDALYNYLAQLGLPAIGGSSSQAANPVTMSNSTQFPSTSLITDLQRPGTPNLSSFIIYHLLVQTLSFLW